MIARRTFIKGASALAATTSGLSVQPGRALEAPNSSGSDPAKLKAPAGACDCQHHIYYPARFPPSRPEVQQVPNARLAGVFNMGGAAVANYVSILEPLK